MAVLNTNVVPSWIVVNDEELNVLILGLDALIDEWSDAGKPMDGYSWVTVADKILADLNSRRENA